MPDRELTWEEIQKLLEEKKSGKLRIMALGAILNEKTKPTLHDLCIHELHAIAEVQRQIIIQQGRDIEALKERLKALEGEKWK